MPFVQAPINYAAQYGRELANAYPYLSYYGDLWNAGESQRFRPLNGKTVYIPSMRTSGARATNRDQITGVFNRNANLEWQAAELDMDREWDTLVDPMDMVESNEVFTIANITATFNQFQKTPEMDAYMSYKLAGFASRFGGVSTTALTKDNILEQWDNALAYMTNQRVNRDRVRCKMTPATYKLLKEAAGLTRFVQVGTGIRDVDRTVGKLDGVLIEEVPSDMMMTAYDFTTGWLPLSTAQQMNFVLYDAMALAAPVVYDTSMISPPTAQSKGKWLYYERYYYGVFCLMQRGAGVYAHLGTAPSLGALTVTTQAGTENAGDMVLNVSGDLVSAMGVEGLKLVYSAGNDAAVKLTYGAVPPTANTWVEMDGNTVTVTGQTAGKYVTVAQVNKQTGFVVAGGSAVEVVKA